MKDLLRKHSQVVWPLAWYLPYSLSQGRGRIEKRGEAGVLKTEFSLEHNPPRLVATVTANDDGREWNVAIVTMNDDIALLKRLLARLGSVVGESIESVGNREVDL